MFQSSSKYRYVFVVIFILESLFRHDVRGSQLVNAHDRLLFCKPSVLPWVQSTTCLHLHYAAQSQKAGSANFLSKQLLPFGFAERHCSTVQESPAVQKTRWGRGLQTDSGSLIFGGAVDHACRPGVTGLCDGQSGWTSPRTGHPVAGRVWGCPAASGLIGTADCLDASRTADYRTSPSRQGA